MKHSSKLQPIAIIGLGLRLPQADSLDQFSQHLLAGRDLIREVDPKRWDPAGLRGNPRSGNKTESIWGGFIDDADCFDADFFKISPREAAWMDPQQRFALEMAWHAIEDAGYRASDLAGSKTGVFMGVCHWDYAELLEKHVDQLDAYTPTGIAYSIIANRVSYFFDFQGPSITNDTACAASLVSIYEAVQALRDGTCNLALAGGVNLCWSPNHFIAFSKAGMLSKDGKEKTFDQGADGYVRGEGGAVLLLKPLDQALADADPIHGVIRAVGTNHGGRTNSLTVTNPNAQADLIAQVYRAAAIDPAQVGYIETHGTGTPLGDPIEIRGLKQAFADLAPDGLEGKTCGLGSVKTNIGHLEGAAGVAGVVKVLAAMQAEQLPPLVNFKQQNDLIKLDDSPFYLVDQKRAWPRGQQPRLAGVSSFGFGGSNAHLLLEEAPHVDAVSVGDSSQQFVVPLSAQEPAQLKAYAQRLLVYLNDHPDFDALANLAYTFQLGRESMSCKLALCVANIDDLKAGLTAYVSEQQHSAIVTLEQAADSALLETAQAWFQDQTADWAALYSIVPQRLHLPVYPFARVRHWMEPMSGKDSVRPLHPLLHRNTSSLDKVRFSSQLSSDAFYFADHQVQGRKVLPGVASMEMMLAALREVGFDGGQIRDLAWRRPIHADSGTCALELEVERLSDQQLKLEIYQEGQLCVSAVAVPDQAVVPEPITAAQKLNAGTAVDRDDCYRRLCASGMVHGPAFRALDQLRQHADGLWLKLSLPRKLHAQIDTFTLHPSILDAALQAWVALDLQRDPSTPWVPIGCQSIRVFAAMKKVVLAHLRLSETAKPHAQMMQLDVDLYDRKGNTLCQLRGVTMRSLAHKAQPQFEGDDKLSFLQSDWQAVPLTAGAERQATVFGAQLDTSLPDAQKLESLGSDAATASAWFHQVRAHLIAALKQPKAQPSLLVLVPDEQPDTWTQPLVALFKCVSRENPRFLGRVVRIAGEYDAARMQTLIKQEARQADRFCEVRYAADDTRHVKQAAFVTPSQGEPVSFSGVCWITGGLGGVGQHLAEYVVQRGATQVVLSGRSALNDDKRAALDALQARGIPAHYLACDISDAAACAQAVATIERDFGPVEQVIHAAGIVQDRLLINSDSEVHAQVFAAKVQGTQNLDRALKDQPLRHFWLTSSVAACYGNVGQADYAAANAFMDAFATLRNQRVANGQAKGTTLALQWPLWQDGGMGVDQAGLKALQRNFGTQPMPVAAAFEALDVLGNSSATTALHYGDRARLQAALDFFALAPETLAVSKPTATKQLQADSFELKKQTLIWLKEVFADAVQTEPERIQSRRKLEAYGFDSIVIVDVTQKLEEALGPMPMTLFFEYVDLEGIATYLLDEHRDALEKHLGVAQAVAVDDHVAPVDESVAPERKPRIEANDSRDIAIIGHAFRYPGADDAEAFWDMLAAGNHAFERFPQDRWNHAAIYHPERDVLGKTTVQNGAFIDDIDKFDPRYFHISQYEAELMAPEVRLFLQKCVEAFEDAGYSKETLAKQVDGDVAVLVGSMNNEYDYYGFQNMLLRGGPASGSYMGTIPNMVSYFYGFKGPSYFLTTMCSAALVCVHEAVQMLREGRCQMALAGGVSLLSHPQKLIGTSQEHFTTKTATVIRGYGEGADGTILGEGVNAVVLKPLAKALADGDRVYGVIKGTGVSNAGVRNGFTVPTPAMQQAAISAALADAKVDARTISYLEGHGSGTALGDPIEIRAASAAFAEHTSDKQFCPIGTVKSNLAHLLAASGLAGVSKVLLQLQHGELVPSLHATPTNPAIAFEKTPFYVQKQRQRWQRPNLPSGEMAPRRAGVTSIGAGGVNAHVIIEEAPEMEQRPPVSGAQLLVFSAMNLDRLKLWLQRVSDQLQQHPSDLDDLAFTLQVGRNTLPCRLAIQADSMQDLQRKLAAFLKQPASAGQVHYNADVLQSDLEPDDTQVVAAVAANNLAEVAHFWVNGCDIDWYTLPRLRQARRVALPAYPFERIRCWYPEQADAPSVLNPLSRALKLHPFVGSNLSTHQELRFQTTIRHDDLLDYCYQFQRQRRLLPSFIIETALAVAQIAMLPEQMKLMSASYHAPDVVLDQAQLDLKLSQSHDGFVLDFVCRDKQLAQAKFAADTRQLQQQLPLPAEDGAQVSSAIFYSQLKDLGLDFTPYGDVIQAAVNASQGQHWFRLKQPSLQQDHFKQKVQLPQIWLQAITQSCCWLKQEHAILGGSGAWFHTAAEAAWLCLEPLDTDRYSIYFVDQQGQVVAGCERIEIGTQQLLQTATAAASSHDLHWHLRLFAAELLKFDVEAVDLQTPFYDFGFDSISLTKLSDRINDALATNLTPTVFFDCQNLAELADYIGSKSYHLQQVAAVETPAVRPQTRSATKPSTPQKGVAIVGMYAQLPGGELEEVWQKLLAGEDLVGDFPMARWSDADQARLRESGMALRGGFIDNVDCFDAAHFKISPAEAQLLDPQARLALEATWRALHDAALRPDQLPQDTGVFFGVTGKDYLSLLQDRNLASEGFAATGNSHAMLANRISFHLNVRGPSQPIDTACSSSLVALHRAAEQIKLGRCSLVIAGGVNLNLNVDNFLGPHGAGMLSSSGQCKTFAADADGYVRGEGVVCLVLKDLAAAERDGDRIWGVLTGSAENHGGRASSLTAPNAQAQAQLIQQAMQGLDADRVQYIETHGTGTALGDPVEINALRSAYSALGRSANAGPIGLGAIKSQIGHLEAAAGLAGVVKILMAFRDGALPPSLHCQTVNPYIDLADSPFQLVRQRQPLQANQALPMCAAVSSFGFGGANAHAVFESYAGHPVASSNAAGPHIFCLSANNSPLLVQYAQSMLDFVEGSEAQLGDICFSLLRGREPLSHRLAVVADDKEALRQALRQFISGTPGAYLQGNVTQTSARVDAGDPQSLAQAWIKGGEILSHIKPARLVALPPFPFAQTRYWLPQATPDKRRPDRQVSQNRVLQWRPEWQAQALSEDRAFTDGQVHRFTIGLTATDLQAQPLTKVTADLADSYTRAAVTLMQRLQQVMKGRNGNTLVQLVIAKDANWQAWSGLGAMLESAAAEAPQLRVQLVIADQPDLASLDREAKFGQHRYVRLDAQARQIRSWREVSPVQKLADVELAGCYVITGGLGGLGRLLVQHLAQRNPQAAFILLGRRPLDQDLRANLRQLQQAKVRAFYRIADLSDLEQLNDLCDELKLVFGTIHTLFHCAATTRDGYLLRKTETDLRAVFQAKVQGTQTLVDLCQQHALRLGCFSSLGGAVGNPGQADYAAANGFMDGLACAAGQQTINWPFWQEGGLQLDDQGQTLLFEQMGQRPMPSELGLQALEQIMVGSAHQTAVVYGDTAKLRHFFDTCHQQQTVSAAVKTEQKSSRSVFSALRALFAKVSGHAEDTIQADEPLEVYGIDSLMVTRLNRELGEMMGPLSKTLFYEYQTLGEVAQHLAATQDCSAITQVSDDIVASSKPDHHEAIAIIGISGQYPGCDDLEGFTEMLAKGDHAVGEIPSVRWSLDDFFEADPQQAVEHAKSYSKHGAFLDGFANFDADYFNISRREAAAIDPQERLFLQAATHAFEHAGYPRHRLVGDCGSQVGVFAGVTKSGFGWHPPFQTAQGATVKPRSSFSSIANRVSYYFGLQGPSMPVDTMCSSSLTAIHLACEALREGNCQLALAGGVNLYLHADNYVELCASRMLSPSGVCHSFGAAADGFVPGEGVGCVVLKPLSVAERDGDRVLAVIRGSAINHGGKTNGYTVPNPKAQSQLIRAALKQADLQADDIGLIEAHGTGTVLGDPIEVAGLTEAFRQDTQAKSFAALSTVKANIGHLEAAAGIAGLTRVLAQMQRGQRFVSINCEPVNPNLDLHDSPFYLVRENEAWPSDKPQIAGISSFGAGGSNAHLIVEAYAAKAAGASEAPTDRAQLIPISAKDQASLRRYAQSLRHFVQNANPSRFDVDSHWLQQQLAELLAVSVEAIDLDEDFGDLGVSPIQLQSLINLIEQHYQIKLPTQALQATSLQSLQQHCATKAADAMDLADLAFTFQISREPLPARLAVVANNMQLLHDALSAFLAGEQSPNLITAAQASAEAADAQQLWQQDQLHALAALWLNGNRIDWLKLPRQTKPRLIDAPGYPFAETPFWLGKEHISEATVSDHDQTTDHLLAYAQSFEKALAELTAAVLNNVQVAQITRFYQPWFTTLKQWLPQTPLDLASAWQQWQQFKENSEAGRILKPQLELVEATLKVMPQIVTGTQDPLAIMFPNGSHAKVEGVYKEQPIALHFNRVLAQELVKAIIDLIAKDPHARIRILEVGAGTGGTSAFLFQQLKPYQQHIETYCFTDISKSFLNQAKAKYLTDAPYLSFAICNAEKPLREQEIEVGSYDIVIAANVLHATRNMRQTVTHVREALKAGGKLILNEMSGHTLFGHLTFGLLDGWWRFEDGHLRIPGGPALSGQTWLSIMRESGFADGALPRPQDHELGQMIVVGVADQQQPKALVKAVDSPTPQVAQEATSKPVTSSIRPQLLQALAKVLDMAPDTIHLTKSFADYGLDSILGIELIHHLNDLFSLDLETTCLFDFHNVHLLEAHITEQLQQVEVRAIHAHAATTSSVAQNSDRGLIAIIGMAGRFAESDDVHQWWQHLQAGRNLVKKVDRWDLRSNFADLPVGSYCEHGSFLNHIDHFDPLFFNISGLEATYMDPQQRIFLEEAWKALEDAGHAGQSIVGSRTGVFVGCSAGDYQELFNDKRPPGQAFWGNTSSLIPARIAYFLDLKGPALAIDTACSSSLTAVHAACRSLWSGESSMAIAGGVFVQATPRFYRYANGANMLSPSGHCAAFDASADGIVPGEAAAAVVLRPLADALAAGDHIYAVIEAAAINQDGATNGITAPSAQSQERLIRETYESANIDAASISLVEAHGTGTPLGDPIEFAALKRAFRKDSEAVGYCSLGSVKANMGHATTAAGIAGLVKVLLALKHRTIPPLCHLNKPNPEMRLEGSPFVFDQQAKPWQSPTGQPRRAAISSFGFSGTNAHLVIREANEYQALHTESKGWHIATFSARTQAQLRTLVTGFGQWLPQAQVRCIDLAFTLLTGRRHMVHRLAICFDSLAGLQSAIKAWLQEQAHEHVFAATLSETSDNPPASAAAREALARASESTGRLEDLASLAQAYCQGQELDYAQLFAKQQTQRVPLPTYAFAQDRYWVKGKTQPEQRADKQATSESKPSAVRQASPAPTVQRVEVTGKTDKIKLQPVDSMATQVAAASQPRTVKLKPLSAPTPSAIRVQHKDAICILSWQVADTAILDELRQQLHQQARHDQLKLITLVGDFNAIAADLADLLRASSSFKSCALPILAAPTTDLGEAALTTCLLCDFSVLEATFNLSWKATVTPQLRRLLETKLGCKAARQLLRQGDLDLTSAKQLGSPLSIHANDQVMQVVHQLQSSIADAPRVALTALKQHLRRNEHSLSAPAEATKTVISQYNFDDVTLHHDGNNYLLTVHGPAGLQQARRQIEATPGFTTVALCCDDDGTILSQVFAAHALILSADCNYSWQYQLTQILCDQAREHLGSSFTAPFLLSQQSFSGSQLAVRASAIEAHSNPGSLTLADVAIAQTGTSPIEVESIPAKRQLSSQTDVSATKIPLATNLISLTAYSDGVAHLVMQDRDSKNSFTNQMMDALETAFAVIADPQRAFKVCVLSGFDNYFASGGTRDGLISLQQGQTRFTDRTIYTLPANCPIPVIAAMQGHAIGAGWSMGLFCDAVLMSESAVYHSNYLWFGFTPGAGATWAVPNALGEVLGHEVLYSAKPYKGRDLKARLPQLHIVDQVCTQALQLAHQLAQQPRQDLIENKRHLQHNRNRLLPDVLERELALHQHTFIGSDHVAQRIESLFQEQQPEAEAKAQPTQGVADLRTPLVASLAEELMIDSDAIRDNASFLELGLDSILASTWVQQLNKIFALELVATDVYAYPTVKDLLEYIDSLVPQADVKPEIQIATAATAKVTSDTASTQDHCAAILNILAEELMISSSDIRYDANFLDLGLDSILALTFVQRLNDQFGWQTTATQVYAHPTVGDFLAMTAGLASENHSHDAPKAEKPVAETQPVIQQPSATDDALLLSLQQSLAEELLLAAEDIQINAKFLDLGLDSILALTWVRKLNTEYQVELAATVVYTYPTLAELAQHLQTLQPKRKPVEAPVEAPKEKATAAQKTPVVTQNTVAKQATRAKTQTAEKPADDRRIAVIGMAGRFPKADDLDTFWQNILQGRDCIDQVPKSRFDIASFYDPDPQADGKTYCKWMGSLDNVDQFDPFFFNMTPREAELSDPQQRLFLQSAWHCIEDAGYDPKSLSGSKCGVFVGCGPSGYEQLVREQNAYSLIGGAGSILSARIAYLLNLKGPSLAIDTACSSSLVAIAQACNSLILGDCDSALAGGVSVLIGPSMHVGTSKVSMLSKDGRCFSFDARANGFVPGEGVGVVMLKRLGDAIEDGDPVHAVISGWGINQDGKTNGITAPNPLSQASLQQEVYRRFNIDPETIELVEAHGTGTPLGDPIEIEGLTNAFKSFTDKRQYCAIGSVKSNVGHLLAAAGVAGFIKAAKAVEHAKLPTTANFDTVNPLISLEKTPFYINTQSQAWPHQQTNLPRRAAISSFGFSGTNAHIVVESYSAPAAAPESQVPQYFLLSAASREQLQRYAHDMADWLEQHSNTQAKDVAFTSQVGRTPLKHRLSIRFEDLTHLSQQLRQFAAVGSAPDTQSAVYKEPNTPSIAPEDQRRLQDAVKQRNFTSLAELWLRGVIIPWSEVWEKQSRQRLHLPTYPFAEMRCWVDTPAPGSQTPTVSKPSLRVQTKPNQEQPTFQITLPPEQQTIFDLPNAVLNAAKMLQLDSIQGLQNLIWSPDPLQGDQVTVQFFQNGDGVLYSCYQQDPQKPLHLGTLDQTSTPDAPAVALNWQRLNAVTPARHFAAEISELHHNSKQLRVLATLDQNEQILPAQLLHLIQQLGQHLLDEPQFQLFALQSLQWRGPAPQTCEIMLEKTGKADAPSFNLSIYHSNGTPWLDLCGLLLQAPQHAVALTL